MKRLTRAVADELLQTDAETAVTIYLPVHKSASPGNLSENQIRLKNLIHAAVEDLAAHGGGKRLADELLAAYDSWHDDLSFWEGQSAGLLICAEPGQHRLISLPVDTEEYVAVDNQYHLAPVLGLLQDDRPYYLLVLAQQEPKLFQGDMYGLRSAGISLPTNIRDALNLDEPNRKSEHQGTATGVNSQGGSAHAVGRSWFNGRGGAKNPQEADRLRFFRLIDSRLCQRADTDRPLIMAGVDSELAEYRGISNYPTILKGSIEGNRNFSKLDELAELAGKIIQHELIRPVHQAAAEEFERLNGSATGRTAVAEGTIMQAAQTGRVDTLLTSMVRSTSDTVQDSWQDVLRLTFPKGDGKQNLNKIALKVWQTSGRVLNLLPAEMPAGTQLAASLRY